MSYAKVPVAVVDGFVHVVHPADSASRGRVYLACVDPEHGPAVLPDEFFPDTLDYGFAVGAKLRSVDGAVECTVGPCGEALRPTESSPRDRYYLGLSPEDVL